MNGSLKNALAMLLLPAALLACGGSSTQQPPDAGGCTATFSGNFADTARSSSCASLATDGGTAGDTELKFSVTSAVAGAPTAIDIDLGQSPQAGVFSSETVADWDATGINTGDCEFSAGSTAVPSGSFNLTLVSLGDADAGPHGELKVVQYVKAPPGTDCGTGDTENIDITF